MLLRGRILGQHDMESQKHRELFRELRLIVTEPLHHNRRVGKLEENRPAIDGINRMSAEQEADDDAKISTSPPHRPNKVRIIPSETRYKAAVGEHHVRFEQMVRCQAILAA